MSTGWSGAVARVWTLVGALALFACGGETVLGDYPASSCDLAAPPSRIDGTTLSIASFWVRGREADALRTLEEEALARGFHVSTLQMPTRVEAQLRIDEAFDGRELPDVVQANGGSDVLRWVERGGPGAPDVCTLHSMRSAGGWDQAYFEPALKPLSCRGQLYGLPIGIHHINVVFYNEPLFAELQELASSRGLELTPPNELTSVHELLAQLKLVDELGVRTPRGAQLVPLALGGHDEWPLTIAAFENVLLGLDAAAYQWLWYGGLADGDAGRRQRLRESLAEMLVVLRQLHDVGNFREGKTWQAALGQVGAGEALMTIMGDWGFAQLMPPELERVRLATFPGTSGYFVYTPDSFAVPRAPKTDGFPARAFLEEVVSDKDVLIQFSNVKHSIPPRRDLTPREIEELGTSTLRETYREFSRCASGEDCELLLAVSGLGPPPGSDPCFDRMDALLTYAVTGERREPSERGCPHDFPDEAEQAEQQLIELLLDVASRRFAADCR